MEPKYKYSEYLELKRKAEAAKAARLWERYRILDDRLEKMRPLLIPEKEMPGTVIYYSDKSSGHVKEVIDARTVLFEMTGLYTGEKIFTLRKSGAWVQRGQKEGDGVRLALGYKHDYYCEEI